MSDLTDRFAMSQYASRADRDAAMLAEIDRLLIQRDDYKSDLLAMQRERDALRETQAKFGQVQHDLLSQIDALREQLALAEAVRASQVAGLTEGAEKLRGHLGNLLAVVHGDGGHYEAEHGTDKAVVDALERYYDNLRTTDATLYALRERVAGLEQDAARYRATLLNVRLALDVANTTPNGPICDTIWYSDHETLFDYIDAALKGEA